MDGAVMGDYAERQAAMDIVQDDLEGALPVATVCELDQETTRAIRLRVLQGLAELTAEVVAEFAEDASQVAGVLYDEYYRAGLRGKKRSQMPSGLRRRDPIPTEPVMPPPRSGDYTGSRAARKGHLNMKRFYRSWYRGESNGLSAEQAKRLNQLDEAVENGLSAENGRWLLDLVKSLEGQLDGAWESLLGDDL